MIYMFELIWRDGRDRVMAVIGDSNLSFPVDRGYVHVYV